MIQKILQFVLHLYDLQGSLLVFLQQTHSLCQGLRNAPEAHISEYGTKSLKRFQVIDLPDKITFTVLNK